jgi:hypothetical protein
MHGGWRGVFEDVRRAFVIPEAMAAGQGWTGASASAAIVARGDGRTEGRSGWRTCK